jgi:hypothetical protein
MILVVEEKIDWMLLEDLNMSVYHEMQSNRLVVEVINYLSQKYMQRYNLPKFYVVEAVNEYIEAERKMKICEATNHGNGRYIVSDDYGGPESGYMGYHCKKCGFSAGRQLY